MLRLHHSQLPAAGASITTSAAIISAVEGHWRTSWAVVLNSSPIPRAVWPSGKHFELCFEEIESERLRIQVAAVRMVGGVGL